MFLPTFVCLANAYSSLKKWYLPCEAMLIAVFSVLRLCLHGLWFSISTHPVLLYLFLCSGSRSRFSVILSLSAFSLPCPSCQRVNVSDLCPLKNKPQMVTESFHFSIHSPSPSWYYFSKEWCVPGASDFSYGTPSSTSALHSGSSKPYMSSFPDY